MIGMSLGDEQAKNAASKAAETSEEGWKEESKEFEGHARPGAQPRLDSDFGLS